MNVIHIFPFQYILHLILFYKNKTDFFVCLSLPGPLVDICGLGTAPEQFIVVVEREHAASTCIKLNLSALLYLWKVKIRRILYSQKSCKNLVKMNQVRIAKTDDMTTMAINSHNSLPFSIQFYVYTRKRYVENFNYETDCNIYFV